MKSGNYTADFIKKVLSVCTLIQWLLYIYPWCTQVAEGTFFMTSPVVQEEYHFSSLRGQIIILIILSNLRSFWTNCFFFSWGQSLRTVTSSSVRPVYSFHWFNTIIDRKVSRNTRNSKSSFICMFLDSLRLLNIIDMALSTNYIVILHIYHSFKVQVRNKVLLLNTLWLRHVHFLYTSLQRGVWLCLSQQIDR